MMYWLEIDGFVWKVTSHMSALLHKDSAATSGLRNQSFLKFSE